MHLAKIAAHKITEKLEAWDETTQAFVPDAFVGRIDLTDRFLSNFNKPLRRRALFTEFGTQFPESRTIRHPGTKQVYLIGQTRPDALDGNPYLEMTVLHLATEEPGGSSGLATIYRKAPAGPSENPGWLVEQEVAKAYMDIEFRTSANEADTYEIKVENYYAFLPRNIQCKPWDYIELQGKRLRVVDTFPDSGLSGLRVDEEPDVRIDFVLKSKGTRTYNKVTHVYEEIPAEFKVTGVVIKDYEFSAWSSDAEAYIDVSIESEHIGFRPVPNTMSLVHDGRARVIKQVSTQPGTRQYRLRCE